MKTLTYGEAYEIGQHLGLSSAKVQEVEAAVLAKLVEPSQAGGPCEWTLDDDESGTWASSCGELWSFIDGGPAENRVTYCHHCGKRAAINAKRG